MMNRYQKYRSVKLKWFDEIPENWNLVSLKNLLAKIYGGGTPSTSIDDNWGEDDDPNCIPWVAISDITKSNGVLYETSKKITEKGRLEKGLEIVPRGTLLLSIFASLGKTTRLGIDATINQAILGLVPSTKLNLDFLEYLLIDAERYVSYYSSASTQENLNLTKIRNLQFPIPSIEEQTKIVQYLDYKTAIIDQLIQQKEKLIELLKEKRQAIINEAVTKGLNPSAKMKDSGIAWMGEVPEHWNISKLKWNLEFCNNKRVPLEAAERYNRKGQYPYYGASGIIDFIDDFIFEGDFILVGEDGANILSRSTPLAFIASGKFWVNNHAHILRVPSGEIDYFCEQLELNDFSTIASGSAQPKLTKEALANLKIIVPPVEEQAIIVAHIKKSNSVIDDMISKILSQIEKLKDYRQSIISEAVTGKIDVRDWQSQTKQLA